MTNVCVCPKCKSIWIINNLENNTCHTCNTKLIKTNVPVIKYQADKSGEVAKEIVERYTINN